MQAFVVILSVLLISFASGDEKSRNEALQHCKSTLSAGDEMINFVNSKKAATTEQERCFLECFYGRIGLIENGKLSQTGSDALAKARFGDNTEAIKKSQDIFNKCQSSYTATNEKCSLGKHVRDCFIQNDSEQLNFFPNKQ